MKNDSSELITYLDKEFRQIHSRMDDLGQKFDSLQNSVDSYAKRADAYFQEMVVLGHKVDRHEKWLQQIADKVGIKLTYE